MPRANTLVAALKIKLLVFALKEIPKNGSQMERLVWNTKRKTIPAGLDHLAGNSDNNIRYMENQLEIIKSNLPYGYEGSIAKEAGCSKGTVHNILNNKPASARSSYKAKVLTIATRMAKEALEASKGVSKAAAELETLQNGTTSEQ